MTFSVSCFRSWPFWSCRFEGYNLQDKTKILLFFTRCRWFQCCFGLPRQPNLWNLWIFNPKGLDWCAHPLYEGVFWYCYHYLDDWEQRIFWSCSDERIIMALRLEKSWLEKTAVPWCGHDNSWSFGSHICISSYSEYVVPFSTSSCFIVRILEW